MDELEFFDPFDKTHPIKFKPKEKNVAAGYLGKKRLIDFALESPPRPSHSARPSEVPPLERQPLPCGASGSWAITSSQVASCPRQVLRIPSHYGCTSGSLWSYHDRRSIPGCE